MTVLVVDGPFEAGTDLIVGELASAGVSVFRMDTAEFPLELEFHSTFCKGQWNGLLATNHRRVSLSDIKAVYWNRPGTFRFPGLSEADEHYARGAARIGLGGILASIDAPFMNHPSRATYAEFKPQQLRIAGAVGLATPHTLITSDPDAVRRFARLVHGPIITKPLGAPVVAHKSGWDQMYTRRADLSDLKGVPITAHLYQEEVAKDFEVRAMFIGGTCYSARIDAGSDQARLDYRSDYDAITVTPMPTPAAVQESLHRYAAAFNLAYFAADFIVTPAGEWVFLEANPSGQWAWVNSVDLPLAAAFAKTLEEWCSNR
ncbi:MvdC/MvdD family ATP grasp protein [Streptomyces sp. NPDC091377]|uniref:MvdC/MvdD family ATP grasp protein n=1 Tax=unclassified Streptomyces TaxID=2593676 RepID=UPI00380C5193